MHFQLKKQHRRYAKYKDTGIVWLREVPEGWEVKKLKYIAPLRNKKTANTSSGLPYIALENIESWTRKLINLSDNPEYESTVNEFEQGDVLFGKLRPYLAKVALTDFKGVCSSELLVLKPEKVAQNYLSYMLISNAIIDIVNSSTYGAKMPRTNWSFIGNLQVACPDQEEQTAIADYLDEKTALLDSTITAKKKQIKLLKERRIALINKAVMQGIDEGVEMKESGVEWIGKVPKVWEVNRIGSCFLERKRKVSDKDFSALSVTKNGIVPQLENAAKTDDGDNRKLIKKGDFVINSRSDRKGSSGTSNFEGSTSLISIVLKSVKLAPQFTHFLFRSDSFIEEYYRMGRGIVADLWTTRYKEMKNINIAFPSKIEQIKIANYLDFEIVKINETMALIEKSIALLEEYKASLVSHVVTGKIKIS